MKIKKEIAYPPGNISDDIQNAINDLENAALPNQMTLAPVRMINDNDREMNVFDTNECKEKREEIRKQNNENIQEFKDIFNDFKTKYSVNWNKYFNKEKADFSLYM